VGNRWTSWNQTKIHNGGPENGRRGMTQVKQETNQRQRCEQATGKVRCGDGERGVCWCHRRARRLLRQPLAAARRGLSQTPVESGKRGYSMLTRWRGTRLSELREEKAERTEGNTTKTTWYRYNMHKPQGNFESVRIPTPRTSA